MVETVTRGPQDDRNDALDGPQPQKVYLQNPFLHEPRVGARPDQTFPTGAVRS